MGHGRGQCGQVSQAVFGAQAVFDQPSQPLQKIARLVQTRIDAKEVHQLGRDGLQDGLQFPGAGRRAPQDQPFGRRQLQAVAPAQTAFGFSLCVEQNITLGFESIQ